jgi:HEAT repeat protein
LRLRPRSVYRPAMDSEQFDLFSGSGLPPGRPPQAASNGADVSPEGLDDDALLAAILTSGLTDGPALVDEAARRCLPEAVPVLERYCRRFAGFGVDHPIPEQAAVLHALAAIGTREATATVTRIIAKAVVQGPTLKVAVRVAGSIGCRFPAEVSIPLLHHADPVVRADACRCARPAPEIIPVLLDLLDDLNEGVVVAAACALGRMGRSEARPILVRWLREAPSPEIADAVSMIADEDCVVLLGRLLRADPVLADVARSALENCGHSRAEQILGRNPGRDITFSGLQG